MKYQSTKTFGHERGLSCCFRQHKANSHCNLLHGYALSFKFVFGAEELDSRGWVVDFGCLKGLEEQLRKMFDHTTVIAMDDPMGLVIQEAFKPQFRIQIADVRILKDGVGCEKFAKLAYEMAVEEINQMFSGVRNIRVVSCECAEHGANSAIYYGE